LVYAQNSFGLSIERNKKSVSIPFELYNNLIVLKVKYNNFLNLNFILDTGVRSAILTDVRIALLLNPKFVRPIKLQGLGAGEELEAFVASGVHFSMDGLVGKDQLLIVLTQDVFSLSKFLGKSVHGLLGFEIFNRFVVEIDYKNKVLRLYEPSKYKFNGKGEVIPITIEDSKPFMMAETVLNGKTIPVKLIVDTGAGHALSLYRGSNPEITHPPKVIHSLLGRGLNGDISGSLGRVEKFRVGGMEFNSVVTTFPDTTNIGMVMLSNGRNGNLGADLLGRFKVTFDYSRNQMILKPYKIVKKDFQFNMSGLDLISDEVNFDRFIVDRVRDNSPAKSLGIKEGDELISLNGRPASDYKLSDINDIFQTRPGRKISLRFRRGKEIIHVKLTLENLI
jgi:hypothetical protein